MDNHKTVKPQLTGFKTLRNTFMFSNLKDPGPDVDPDPDPS